MSESESGQEKTEQPTQRRLKDSLEKGQILTSKDLVTGVVLLVGAMQFAYMGQYMFLEMVGYFRQGFSFADELAKDRSLLAPIVDQFGAPLLLIVTFSIPLIVAAILCQGLLGGVHFITENLSFKGSRISPAAGLGRMFGSNGVIELLKAIAKVAALGSLSVWFFVANLPDILRLSSMSFEKALDNVGGFFLSTLLILIGAIAVIGAVDALIQWRRHTQQLMMTRQETKDEHKQTEGSPEVKQRIRRMQQEMAQRGSVANVGEAQVVIVNPTRFAVALRYDFEEGSAPKVVSKGSDSVAMQIREQADAKGIPVLTMPLLARALFYTSEIGAEIHADLYRAVATILSFVFQTGAQGETPEVEVPEELQFDSNGRKLKGAK